MPDIPSEKLSLTDYALQLLNTLQLHDPEACASLMSHKVQVSEAIASHPDFVCQTARGGKVQLGMLGMINGLLTKSGNPKVAVIVDDDGAVIGFTKRLIEKPVSPAPIVPAAPPKN